VKTSRLIGLVVILVALVSLVSIWLYPSVQAFMATNTMWNGINKFSKVYNVQNIDSVTTLPASPQQDVLIVVPYTPFSTAELAQMKQFVENGGKLILMDDFGYGNSFLSYAGVSARFDNTPLLDPLFNYKNEYFPRILDFDAGVTGSGIKLLAFNHGSALSGVTQSQALAWSSSMSFLDTNQNGNLDPDEPQGPFVVAASITLGGGTIDLVSDSSLIMNAAPGTNDNNAFVNYLMTSSGTPGKVLFDRAQVTKSPLDTSKIEFDNVRGVLSNAYTLVGIIALVFVIITWYIYRRGLLIGGS
jgi:hypothetical protein